MPAGVMVDGAYPRRPPVRRRPPGGKIIGAVFQGLGPLALGLGLTSFLVSGRRLVKGAAVSPVPGEVLRAPEQVDVGPGLAESEGLAENIGAPAWRSGSGSEAIVQHEQIVRLGWAGEGGTDCNGA